VLPGYKVLPPSFFRGHFSCLAIHVLCVQDDAPEGTTSPFGRASWSSTTNTGHAFDCRDAADLGRYEGRRRTRRRRSHP
ncbi:hypothetical protein HPP92_013539, partial [Vanilla planifolia]